MFSIEQRDGAVIVLKGRFDASRVDEARVIFDRITATHTVDFEELSYISSAGLGLLFATHKRLLDRGQRLALVNLNPHIRELFEIAGFDHIFDIA